MQGVPPQDQRSVTMKDLEDALPLIERYKDQLFAIGEVGLDFTPRIASTDDQKEEQRQVLIKQIELAKRLDLPLNVHSRSAGRPTINLLKEHGAQKVLLHAFDGKPSVAMEGVKAGYLFSIPPSIVRSEQQKLVKQLPLENLCLETDSPALGPEKQDIDEVIEKSRKAGVIALVSVTENINEFERMIDLSQRYPSFVLPCFGIHPIQSDADGSRSVTLSDLEPAIPVFEKYKDNLVGIGEIGLDFTPWLASTSQQREEQQKVFRMQLSIAQNFDLPVNVHSRSAGRQTISFLKEHGVQKVLLHNFAGRLSAALEGAQAGYYFSFPPAITRNNQREKIIRQLPLENICLETDSPALGPNKEERNIPENIRISCQYISDVKGLSPETVCEVTSKNALHLFPKIHGYLNR